MKRILITLGMLMLIANLAFGQNSNAGAPKKTAKPKPPAVDCSKMDDGALTTAVKDKLANTPSLKGQTIDVAVSGGGATLTGKVKTAGNKGTATRVVKAVKCVKSVTNKLEYDKPVAAPKAAGAKKPKNS
jgi:hypothetical protein